MLKDVFKRNNKKEEELMPFQLRGKLTIIGERNGEVYHYDEGDNVVTVWAKHATMHLLTSESFSTHGNVVDGSTKIYSSRSIVPTEHTTSVNIDGTVVSDEQYLGNNANYHDGTIHKHLSRPANITPSTADGDDTANGGVIFPFFPTKMLFGTGKEYVDWAAVTADGRAGAPSDITSYAHPKNGGWTSTDFNSMISDTTNYYSNIWNETTKVLTKARTVNDVYSGVLEGASPVDTDFGIPGAIKDCTYRGSSETATKLEISDGKYFAKGSYRGIGRPSFVYAKRSRFFKDGSESKLETGSTAGTESLESRITFTVVLPEQPTGEFYPYNGYTLKIAGLFCDARMLLGNTVPTNNYVTAPTATDATAAEYSNYKKMPGGILFAKRKISPIYKSHDSKITCQWTIYLP